MPTRNPLSDELLLAAISASEAQAIGAEGSAIVADRADAINRYLGKTYTGDMAAAPGRSSVVSRDVSDVIDGVLANVIKPFVSGDQVVAFEPLGPDDEERAQQETDYVNWIALERNNGFLVLNAALKDALLLRSGYVKAYWTKRTDVVIETYVGLTDEEFALLLQDKSVEPTQHSGYPDPQATPPVELGTPPPGIVAPMGQGMPSGGPLLHDVKVRRTRPTEYVRIDPCPPEELLISHRQRTPDLQETDFVQHRTSLTLSELRQMGYSVEDDISDDGDTTSLEDIARQRSAMTGNLEDDETSDPARRAVMFKETWIRIDRDGDGIAELRRVCTVGSNLLNDEEADIIPLAAFCPMLMPHQHIGISVYDMVEDLAKLKTSLLRQFMDNKYLSNNARVFANPATVEIDDLLISRPGGIVRVNGPISENVRPFEHPDTGASALQGLEYLDAVREGRTGYTRQTQGLETDALISKTVGGMQMQLSQSQLRLEMIARTIAETGVRELFRIIHALTLKHSTRAEKVRLRNKWVEVNPREWVRRTDLSIAVGLGSASQQTQISGLMMIGQMQQQLTPLGLVDTMNAYNTARKLVNALGYKNTEDFVHAPPMGPDGKPQPPQQHPPESVQVEQMRQQGAAQAAQARAQADFQIEQMRAELKSKEIELDAANKQREQEGALLLQKSNDERQLQLDTMKAENEQAKNRADQELQITIANINAAARVEVARIGQGVDDGTALLKAQADAAGYGPILDGLRAVLEAVTAPKDIQIHRDAGGRVLGASSVPIVPPTVQ